MSNNAETQIITHQQRMNQSMQTIKAARNEFKILEKAQQIENEKVGAKNTKAKGILSRFFKDNKHYYHKALEQSYLEIYKALNGYIYGQENIEKILT